MSLRPRADHTASQGHPQAHQRLARRLAYGRARRAGAVPRPIVRPRLPLRALPRGAPEHRTPLCLQMLSAPVQCARLPRPGRRCPRVLLRRCQPAQGQEPQAVFRFLTPGDVASPRAIAPGGWHPGRPPPYLRFQLPPGRGETGLLVEPPPACQPVALFGLAGRIAPVAQILKRVVDPLIQGRDGLDIAH